MPQSKGKGIKRLIVLFLIHKSMNRFGILGGTNYPATGTFAEYIVVERSQVILAPDFIDSVHLAGM